MCRFSTFELEDTEASWHHRYNQAINILRAIIFIIRADLNDFVFDEEDGTVDFID